MTHKLNILTKAILFCFLASTTVSFKFFNSKTCPAIKRDPWSYEGSSNGPKQWGRSYPMCYGMNQSPININSNYVKNDRNLEQLELVNYGEPIMRAEVTNDGHTVEIVPRDNTRRYIVIDETKYTLRQLHFHWSKQRNDGTEHAFNGRRFNMEGHFVHTSDRNQTAVVGVLYKSGSENNMALQPIVDILPSVRYRGDEAVLMDELSLEGLLPNNPSSFFRYNGSLTTPPCTEGVTWSVLKEVFYVGNEQLSQFFKLYAVPKEEARPGCRITNNVRPLQRLNGRTVVSST